MKLIRYSVLLFLQFTALCGLAQKLQINFERIGTDKGLSQSNVLCALQDSRGFMWFGTRDGLNRYDGYKFTVYKNDAKDSKSLSNNFVRAIIESKSGYLWIATQGGGLSRFDRQTNQFTNFRSDLKNKNSISSDFVTSLHEDENGNIWIGTENGLSVFDPSKQIFTRYTNDKSDPTSLSDVYVRSVFEDSYHNLWIGTFNGGLNLFNPKNKTFTRFQHNEKNNESITSDNVYTMFEDSKGRFWIGTNGGGLNLLDRQTGTFEHFEHNELHPNSLPANSVYAINEDGNNLWIGTENGGLSLFNPVTKTFDNYQNDEADNTSLSNNSVYCIYKDRKGDMWLGTFTGGLNMVNPDTRRFTHYKHILLKNSLSNNNVLCISEDAKKNLWIGTDGGGLNLFDRKTGVFSVFLHEKRNPNSICGNYVLSVCEDNNENLWIGTWGDGVSVLNKKTHGFKHFKNDPASPSSLSNNNAWKIFKDKDGHIWIGTYGGGLDLYDADKNSFIHFRHDATKSSSLSNDNIYSIFEDSDGNLWVSTDGGGLNLFNKSTQTFSHFLHDDKINSISDNSVGSIYEDSNKNLWIGTGAGLNCYNKKTNRFTGYTTIDGLPNNVIFGILEDNKGNIWISTNKGISMFDPNTKSFKNFGVSDGLQADEFKLQAFCKSYNGAMYFGGINGFNEFYPDHIKPNSFQPPLVITGFQVFNKDVSISTDKNITPLKKDITETNNITISYKSSVLSFEFASLNFTTSEKKQYAYMLEGFDEKWNEIGKRRTTTYTNLDPGKYTFKVKGLNNDGTWSDNYTALQLTITPPYWKTWWFKTIIVLFIAGSLAAFYRIRVKAITKQKTRLEKQVKERTEEVVKQKETLSKNVKELAILKEDLEKEKYFLDMMMDNMPDAIYFKDKESKLIRVSKYMAERFGGTVESMIGKSDFDFQDNTHAREAYEDERLIQKTRKPKIDYIEKELNNDGSTSWVLTTKLPLINSHGEVIGTFGTSRDITKVKQLEEENHAAEMDKAVAQGKYEIASEVMHDIGNAVVGFGSYLNRVRRMQEKENPEILKNLTSFFEEKKSAIAGIIGEAKADAVIKMLNGISQTQRTNHEELKKSVTEQLNIITHIQEILDIQRQYIAGHEGTERKPVNLRNVINDSLSMLLASIDKMAIAVSLNVAPDLPTIKGDRTKLMQAFLNVLKNSMDAVDKNDAEKNITVTAFADPDKLVVQVKDNGNGFDKSIAEQLFSRGFSTKSTGSGLGLYNCRSIVESHEGTIEITSEGPGKGALATIGFKI